MPSMPPCPRHGAAKPWLEQSLTGNEPVALCWVVILAIVRIGTNSRLFPSALTAGQALEVVQGWLDQPAVLVLQPGSQHWQILADLLHQAGNACYLTVDAHLAGPWRSSTTACCTVRCRCDADFRGDAACA
jgi:predicted nucleic acid-binding protein